jgi:hypothetical protein
MILNVHMLSYGKLNNFVTVVHRRTNDIVYLLYVDSSLLHSNGLISFLIQNVLAVVTLICSVTNLAPVNWYTRYMHCSLRYLHLMV